MVELSIVFSVFLGIVVVICLLIKRFVGVPCSYCASNRLTKFAQLPTSLQRTLLTYFRQREGRHPDTDGIFICHPCRLVYDDFSGEKRSRDVDSRLGGGLRTSNRSLSINYTRVPRVGCSSFRSWTTASYLAARDVASGTSSG